MWVQAGFSPDNFYEQTPGHFQLAMEGVRNRLEAEMETRMFASYQSGAFAGLAHHGKLKSYKHYQGQRDAAQEPREMLAMLKSMGARSNMKVTRVKRSN